MYIHIYMYIHRTGYLAWRERPRAALGGEGALIPGAAPASKREEHTSQRDKNK